MNHLGKEKILPAIQSLLRRKYSNNTALSRGVNGITRAIDRKQFFCLCFFDFSRAINTATI